MLILLITIATAALHGDVETVNLRLNFGGNEGAGNESRNDFLC
jgi:hypothetical protein